MTIKYMDYDYLIKSQLETAEKTQRTYANWSSNWSDLLNLIFRLLYFRKDTARDQTDETGFSYYCFERYVRLPYTLQTIYSIWEVGDYLEAIVLVRHLLESFVQLRYFSNHKGKLERHMTATRAKDRVTFKTMFEDLSPGSYEKYGLYSGFAHAGLGSGLFSFDLKKGTDGASNRVETRSGCEFSEKHSSLVMNQTKVLIYGHLNYFPQFFSTYTETVEVETETRRKEILKDLDLWMTGLGEAYPKTQKWLELMKKLIQ